jgi:Calcineurin-like phosphoesterase
LKILVIPDSHASSHFRNDRFTWLGKYIIDTKPDVIVNIGDMADMPSLCSYDKGKKSFEGRRYKADIEAVHDAQHKLFAPIDAYNKQQKVNKAKQYKPRLILTLGNHENRINRAIEDSAQLEGTISTQDLHYEQHGWEVIPFLEPININGVNFCHYFTSGVMGRPIGGEHVAYSLITKQLASCVQGHSHLRDFGERTNAEGKRILGLVVGCYLEPEQREEYAKEANKLWWKGVVMLHDVANGEYEPEFVNIKQLKARYGQTETN